MTSIRKTTTLLLSVLSFVVVNGISVPRLDTNSDWFYIESEQTTNISPEQHFNNVTWLVSEYFSFKAKIAFSLHRNKNTNEGYELISIGRRHYYISKRRATELVADQDECHLDNRHDHSTLFPWRYEPPVEFYINKKMASEPFHLVGVGALWMNLVDDQEASCQLIDYDGKPRTRLSCESSKRRKSTFFELLFEPANKNELRSAQVTRLQSVAHDQWTILEEIKQSVNINKFESYAGDLPTPMMRHRIDQLEALCELVHESSSEVMFPSLMRLLADSDQRSYHISYQLKLYEEEDVADKTNRKLVERQNVQEWFSFKYEMQTFVRNVRHTLGEEVQEGLVIEKLMRLFNVVEGSSVNYEMFLSSGSPVLCKFVTLDEDRTLSKISRLMRRPIKLASHKFGNSTKPHQGEMIGLGALLMNVADIKHKRQLISEALRGHEIHMDSATYASYTIWIAEDLKDQNQRFYFYFKKPTSLAKNTQIHTNIGDLFKIELKRRLPLAVSNPQASIALGGLDDDEELEAARWRYVLIMEIDIFDLATSLYPDELMRAFTVPPNCPPASDLANFDISNYDNVDPDEPTTPSAGVEEPTDDDFSFPDAGDWHAGLEANYKIFSVWSPESRLANQKIGLVEYLAIDQDNWGHLHARLDIVYPDNRRVQFLIDYTLDSIYRIEGEHCEQVAELDDWLRVVSSEMHLAGYQQTDVGKALRHYGLGGLWSLASRSPYVDLHSFWPAKDKSEEGFFKTIWRMRDDPELLAGLKVHFAFLMRTDQELRKLGWNEREMASKLEWIKVNSDGFWKTLGEQVKSVDITNIRIEPHQAELTDFELPKSCLALVRPNRREFPTLIDELQNQQDQNASRLENDIAELDFELSYKLNWGNELKMVTIEVTETNLPGKLSLCSMNLLSNQNHQINLNFWSSVEPEVGLKLDFMLKDQLHICKKAPDLEKLLKIEPFLDLLSGNSSRRFAGLPLTNLWHAFSKYLERHRDQIEIKTTLGKFHTNDEHEHTTWSLDTQQGLVLFETRLDLNGVERLHSAFLETHTPDLEGQKFFIDFRLKKATRIEQLEQVRKDSNIPSLCNAQDAPGPSHWSRFPSLSKLMRPGSRLHMRSEIMLFVGLNSGSNFVSSIKSYFLDEWLQFNEAYRSQCSTGLDNDNLSSTRTFDQLIYQPTREYFDLSKKNHCQMEPKDIREGNATRDVKLTPGSFIGESLFRSEHKITFYGPISLWLLSQDMKLELLFNGQNEDLTFDLNYKLQVFNLFDELQLENWLLTDRWLASHESFGKFIMIFKRSRANLDLHETRLELVQEKVPNSNLVIAMVNYKFQLDSTLFEEFDSMLRIPTGFGCTRSELAKKQADFMSKDYFVFEKTNPFEFEYAAGLMLNRGNGRLEPQTVYNTGKLMRCPERWTAMSVGSLSVNQHEVHHLSGHLSAFTRVSFRDLSSSSRMTFRLINEISGTCHIDLDRSATIGREKILVLTFDDEIIELTMSDLGEYLQSMNGFEKLQQFDSYHDKTEKTTTVIYESKRDLLRLNDRLQGPGVITRKFTKFTALNQTDHATYHSDGQFEFIIYGKAHLTLEVNRLQYIECHGIIIAARAEECFQDSQSIVDNSLYDSETRRRRKFEMRFEARILIDDTGSKHLRRHSEPKVSIQDFDLNRNYFERDFQRLLFTPPDRIPAVQLGKFFIQYEAHGPHLVAKFNLLEPVSLLHESEQIYGHEIDLNAGQKLRALGIEMVTKPANSKFKCSDLCELEPHSCLAFSHCRDLTCSYLQTSNWSELRKAHSDNNVETFLDQYIRTNQNCSVHFWPSFDGYADRLYIDEIVKLIQGQIGQPEESNKFSITMRISTSKRQVRTKFIAVELRELVDPIGDSADFNDMRPERAELSKDFILLFDKSELQLIEMGSDKDLALVKTMMMETENLADCLKRCESYDCKLISYCSKSKVCSLAKDLKSWQQFEAIAKDRWTVRAASEDCAVYIWDYTRNYQRFDVSRQPASFIWKDQVANPLECAVKCELSPIRVQNQSNCLSFDYCLGADSATCYGQKTHVSFDEQLLMVTDSQQALIGHLDGPRPLCSHYSKFVLADFEVIKDKKFAEHKSIIFHDFDLERCAIVCRRDELCNSFEYCSKPVKQDNTCYINQKSLDVSTSTSQVAETGQLDWKGCNIYTIKEIVLDTEMDMTNFNSAHKGQETFPRYSLMWLYLIALISGCILGFVHQNLSCSLDYLRRLPAQFAGGVHQVR